MATWHMIMDAPRHLPLSKAIDAVEKHSGRIVGLEMHPDYPTRAKVYAAFNTFDHAQQFGRENHILNELPIRKD